MERPIIDYKAFEEFPPFLSVRDIGDVEDIKDVKILDEGHLYDAQFGEPGADGRRATRERLCLKVEVAGKIYGFSIANRNEGLLQQRYGRDSKAWVGKTVRVQVQVSRNLVDRNGKKLRHLVILGDGKK